VLLEDVGVALTQENICKCVQISHCSENYLMKQACFNWILLWKAIC